MRFRSLFTLSLTVLLATQPQLLAAAAASASSRQPLAVDILELFTSEGCSSCPPADALLQQIHLKQTPAGRLIVGLSEHVTYWNSLGWKDPYSEQTFTDRQGVYASRLSPEGPYTPQMVLNGRQQFVGSNRTALEQAFRADALGNHADLRIVSSTPRGDGLDLTFSLTGSPSRQIEIIAVLTDDMDHSDVLRGENSGRSLLHVSVARSLSRIATVNGDTERSLHLQLPDNFRHASGSGHHLVLFAQEPHQGPIVGATTIAL